MNRFEVVFNIPSPYRLHMLRALWKELDLRGIGFHVHFMARGHRNRPNSWLNPNIDFPHTYWRDYGIGEYHFNPGLVWHIITNPPHWLLAGSPYDTLTCILIILFSKAKVKIVGAEGNTKTPGKLHGFIGRFKRLIYSKARFASVPGKDAVRYFGLHQSLTNRSMPTPVILPNLVDETRFKPRQMWSDADIENIRSRLGCFDNDKLCIIPARLEPVKGLLPFVEKLTPEMLRGWRVVILGQGSLKEVLVNEIERRKLSKWIIIKDYVSYNDMPLFYAASDLLLLPSIYDPNPLSVPEALFSGLPIALSNQAGNVEEGVTDGRNGWVLPVFDAQAFMIVLKDIFSSTKERLQNMGRLSLTENALFWKTDVAVKKYLDTIVGEIKESK